jgi:hypothetical protein
MPRAPLGRTGLRSIAPEMEATMEDACAVRAGRAIGTQKKVGRSLASEWKAARTCLMTHAGGVLAGPHL